MARIRLNPVTVHRAARNRGFQAVTGLVNDVYAGGRRIAPRGTHRHGSGTAVSGPRLADSFTRQIRETPRFVYGRVTVTVAYATAEALGSSPHRIPGAGRKTMGFKWARGDFSPTLRRRKWRGRFWFENVRHPGNKRPRRFLQTPLAQYGRQRNFKVKIVANRRSFLP